jgi:c-di-AMP phosphodiesterase-like protein
MLYFIDITNLKKRSEEYSLSRPSVMIIMIDNYDELMQNAKESEKSRLLGEIDSVLEDLMSKTSGVIKKLRYDRFFAVVEERHLKDMISGRFEFLQKAREILTNDGIAVTLSVGVGRESRSLSESESSALQALDMALGRGGDQVAIKTENGYDFYGGVSKGFEKRTKVKSRIVATALLELIEASEDVIVMGHKFSDLDCLGASIGLAQAVRAMGKNSSIAVDSEKSLATILIDHLNEQDVTGLFVHPDIALSNVTKNTLLIIVDTHNPQFVESFELYKACETVVVIDHHRKMVNFIGDAVIFYHEPYASSASEMVTEIIQYFGGKNTIGRAEAESLLSGIMLDTRNFAIRTGVRTFEAAAYLRRMGADTVAVRKLFSNSIDTYQRRSRLVSTAEIYKRCAISMCDFMSDDIRIVAPQAADDLLTIFGVDASFVIFEDGDEVKVSARSMGTINVQLIAEALGGGGHQTMAGVQMKNSNIEKARQMLLETIDQYYENNKPVKKE